MEIEGAPLEALRRLAPGDQDALLAFGRPITFRMGSAEILAEFNRKGNELIVNLAHIDGGGEGVLLSFWKLVENYATQRSYVAVRWNVHAVTCAEPNSRLQDFLRAKGFEEEANAEYGRILTRREPV